MTTALGLIIDERAGVPTMEQFRQARIDGGFGMVLARDSQFTNAQLEKARDAGLRAGIAPGGGFLVAGETQRWQARDVCGFLAEIVEYTTDDSSPADSVTELGPSPDLSNNQFHTALTLALASSGGCAVRWLGRRDGLLVYELVVPEPLPDAVKEAP